MIRCALTSCDNNNNGFCARLQEAVLNARGECILAGPGRIIKDNPPWLIDCFSELRSIEGYPIDYDKDRAFLFELRLDYPTVNIVEAVKAWRVWLYDNPAKTKHINYRSRLRRWCGNTRQWYPAKKNWNPDKIAGYDCMAERTQNHAI